jgi:hypothetical protein
VLPVEQQKRLPANNRFSGSCFSVHAGMYRQA